MAKAGSAYNELAKKMAEALEPAAVVKMGQWVEGPDGKREVDVEVRGTFEGQQFFLLIECKDWKNPVDIKEFDKIDSKRKDLLADRVMICSNSGFTKKALRKAARLNIQAVSILAEGDKIVKLSINREFIAKGLSVNKWWLDLFPARGSEHLIQKQWDPRELFYGDLPVVNWLHEMSSSLLVEKEGAKNIVETIAFKQETEFRLIATLVKLRGFRVRMICSSKWFAQTVQEDVSLGYYDWIRKVVVIPKNEIWTIGAFDREAWKELSETPDGYNKEGENGTFRIIMTLMNPIAKRIEYETPQIEQLIGEKSLEIT